MVTGVETAGLVLAALPLIISALTSYQKGLERTSNLWNRKQYELKVRRLIIRLKAQRAQFGLNMMKLIKTAAPDAQFTDLPSDYKNQFWGGKVGTQVEEYLRFNGILDIFHEVVGLYEEYLKEVAGRLLCVSRPANAEKNDLRALLDVHRHEDGKYRFFQRVQFIMKEDDLEDLIKNLNESQLSLKSFIDDSESLHQLEATRSSARSDSEMAKTLYSVRPHAEDLFRTLGAKCKAHCHPCHDAVLLLESRCYVRKHRQNVGNQALQFRILFLTDASPPASSWHETVVAVRGKDVFRTHTRSNLARRRVAFVESKQDGPSMTDLIEVEDLCKTITVAHQTYSCSCLSLFDDGSLFWQRSQPEYQPAVSAEELVSLENLLKERSRLEPEKRIQLALDISASLLQLNTTPWLEKCWTKDTIFFFRDSEGLRKVYTNYPVLLQKYTGNPRNQPREDEPELALLELGVLLLEIWHRQTLEEWVSESNNELVNSPDGRMLVAIRWFKAIKDNLPPNYRDVVGRCLRPSVFDAFKLTWEDAAFCDAVYNNIVEPLLSSCVP